MSVWEQWRWSEFKKSRTHFNRLASISQVNSQIRTMQLCIGFFKESDPSFGIIGCIMRKEQARCGVVWKMVIDKDRLPLAVFEEDKAIDSQFYVVERHAKLNAVLDGGYST